MRDAGLVLELAIAQDRCRIRRPSCWGRGAAPVQCRAEAGGAGGRDNAGSEHVGSGAPARVGAGPGVQMAPPGRARGHRRAGRLGAAVFRGRRDHQGCPVIAGAGSGRQACCGQ
jgi:hypothetical protein